MREEEKKPNDILYIYVCVEARKAEMK